MTAEQRGGESDQGADDEQGRSRCNPARQVETSVGSAGIDGRHRLGSEHVPEDHAKGTEPAHDRRQARVGGKPSDRCAEDGREQGVDQSRPVGVKTHDDESRVSLGQDGQPHDGRGTDGDEDGREAPEEDRFSRDSWHAWSPVGRLRDTRSPARVESC